MPLDFSANATGARPDRRELLKMLKALVPSSPVPSDVVTVTQID
jgi:hypothetical protein